MHERFGDRLVVVGDRKTPEPWSLPRARYLSSQRQEAQGGRLAALLPWNHYCRKMLGYLEAVRLGAEVIYETDDDNLPKADWSLPAFDGVYALAADGRGFVNVYRAFTDQPIWPRGFPLRALRDPSTILTEPDGRSEVRVGVWQALADGDPDVDAIYRLVHDTPCFFREREPLVLGQGTLCPFNSQATAFRQACFPLLYLPAGVTFRVTDILRGLVAQPILWAAGFRLGFTAATVVQERNPHDYLRDFEAEVPLYLHSEQMVATVMAVVRAGASIEANLRAAYAALARDGMVAEDEPARVEAWLADLAAASGPA